MEIKDLSSLAKNELGGMAVTQLYPGASMAGALMAVDLWEIAPGGASALQRHSEEHLLFFIVGSGEVSAGEGRGPVTHVEVDSVVYVGPREPHMLRNTGNSPLRVLVSTPLLVRSERALGLDTAVPSASVNQPGASPSSPRAGTQASPQPSTQAPAQPSTQASVQPSAYTRSAPDAERSASQESRQEVSRLRENAPGQDRQQATSSTPPLVRPQPSPTGGAATPTPAKPTSGGTLPGEVGEDGAPVVDISALMKRGSQVAPPTRERKPEPPIEPEEANASPDVDADEGDAEDERPDLPDLMELHVVFDGGSRGNPGEGFGSYLVQSPGRRPVIKRVEFGDNYTNNQAEYESLISSLRYIIERLQATGRTPDQVQLDIKSDSDLLVNQVIGTYKVKDANLRKLHDQAMSLLEQFAEWQIMWHPREESVSLLGH
ncbi:MAG: cupin domain-containing protein [Chloroflexota bacterium]|nr:cupin domain-containing protein [Chloroflexota bacterium]